MKREDDPCIFHRAVPLGRLDLLANQPVNTSGLYSKPPRRVRIPTRPAQVGVMLENIRTNTGADLTEAFITQYKAPPPTEKDLINFKPYYDEAPIIGSGGLVNRPTLNQQTYLNIINQLNLPPPIVGRGSTLTLVPKVVPPPPALTLAQINESPLPLGQPMNIPVNAPVNAPESASGGGLSGMQTPSRSGQQTPQEVSDDLQEQTRNEVLEGRRQKGLGNVTQAPKGFGKLPASRPAPLNPREPSVSKPRGSNIMSSLSKPFSRFTTVRTKVAPYSSEQSAQMVSEPGVGTRM